MPRTAKTLTAKKVESLLNKPGKHNVGGVREDGIEILREIRAEHPVLPILVYSVYASISLIEECRQFRANGYLVKGIDDHVLPRAIRAVYAGDSLWADQRQEWRI